MTNSRPEIEFAHIFHLKEHVKPTLAFGQSIPEEFDVRFFMKSNNPDSSAVWSLGMQVEITKEGRPQTSQIDFQGELWASRRKDFKGRNLYDLIPDFSRRQELGFAPVNFETVRTITSSVRTLNYFQSLAVAIAFHTFKYENNEWQRVTGFPEIDSSEIKSIAKKFLQRQSRAPRNHVDYERVANLFDEARSIEGANVRDFISVNYDPSDDLNGVPIDTVNNWIRTCRDMKLLPESNYGKSKKAKSGGKRIINRDSGQRK